MSKTLKTLFIVAGMLALVSLGACTREITTVQQVDPGASNCFSCHSDQDTYLVSAEQQWENSLHASGLNTNRASSASCSGCHSSEGFLDLVAGNNPGTYTNPTAIHCFTCHAPHSNSDFSLRATDPVTLVTGDQIDIASGNLCAVCHQARRGTNTEVATPEVRITSTHWGPHYSPQADMLAGVNGYEYDGFTYTETEYHRTLTDNGCVDCHFDLGRNFVVGGHSFNMRADLEGTEVLNTATCVKCHTGLNTFNYNGVQDSVAALGHELELLLEAAGLYHDGHPVAGVTTSQDSAGALWNYIITIVNDRSLGVHNPKYIIGLLQSSIEFMQGPPTANELARGMQD
ncbi:MAG: hypothetical protein R6X35_08660 [Candidatus Krumholzibacteriia bacterium]